MHLACQASNSAPAEEAIGILESHTLFGAASKQLPSNCFRLQTAPSKVQFKLDASDLQLLAIAADLPGNGMQPEACPSSSRPLSRLVRLSSQLDKLVDASVSGSSLDIPVIKPGADEVCLQVRDSFSRIIKSSVGLVCEQRAGTKSDQQACVQLAQHAQAAGVQDQDQILARHQREQGQASAVQNPDQAQDAGSMAVAHARNLQAQLGWAPWGSKGVDPLWMSALPQSPFHGCMRTQHLLLGPAAGAASDRGRGTAAVKHAVKQMSLSAAWWPGVPVKRIGVGSEIEASWDAILLPDALLPCTQRGIAGVSSVLVRVEVNGQLQGSEWFK